MDFVKEICDLKPSKKEFRVSASLLYETFNYQKSNVQKIKERINRIKNMILKREYLFLIVFKY
jgi:hypothetical protein